DLPILGVEVAGIVEDAGDTDLAKGTPVMGLVNGGAYAEYVTMPADRAIVVPENLSFTEAAAIPEVFLTAYQTLFWLGNLQEKETLLIYADRSGGGTAAIQLTKQLQSANDITTAGSEEKLRSAHTSAADTRNNHNEQDFSEDIQEARQKQRAKVI